MEEENKGDRKGEEDLSFFITTKPLLFATFSGKTRFKKEGRVPLNKNSLIKYFAKNSNKKHQVRGFSFDCKQSVQSKENPLTCT